MMKNPEKDCPSCHREMSHFRDNLWECPVHRIFNMPKDDEDDPVTSSGALCPKIDACYKMDMIMDKDILDSQAADAIRSVCAKCIELIAS